MLESLHLKSKYHIVLLAFVFIASITLLFKRYEHKAIIQSLLTTNDKIPTRRLKSEEVLSKPILKGSHFMLETQPQRQKDLQRFCKKYQVPHEKLKFDHNFLFSDQKRFIYCRIPKAACKTWKKVLGYAEGQFESPYDVSHKDLYSYRFPYLANLIAKNKSIEERKDSYFSFFFSRHPFDRLFSAYRNKILNPVEGLESYLDKLGPRIVRLNHKDPATHPKKLINGTEYLDISFEQFLRYVLNARVLDPHWDLQIEICHICNYPFAYLGKFETMGRDANKLFDLLDMGIDKLPEDGQYNKDANQLMKSHYAKLPKSLIRRIYRLYENDFLAFGYDKNEYFKV